MLFFSVDLFVLATFLSASKTKLFIYKCYNSMLVPSPLVYVCFKVLSEPPLLTN